MAPAGSDELITRRNTLAQARRATQGRVVSLGLGAMLMSRLFRDPWFMGACFVVMIGLSVRWIGRYRRLKAELGLQNDYDELDENATTGAKTLLIMFGIFGGMFVFLALFVWALRTSWSGPRPRLRQRLRRGCLRGFRHVIVDRLANHALGELAQVGVELLREGAVLRPQGSIVKRLRRPDLHGGATSPGFAKRLESVAPTKRDEQLPLGQFCKWRLPR
jgi:hypothetical protein